MEKPIDAHYAPYGAWYARQHGDHENDDEAQEMEDEEREILAALVTPTPMQVTQELIRNWTKHKESLNILILNP